jgi:1-deoxy-D-xylulose-5-phosphate reductoisomerase
MKKNIAILGSTGSIGKSLIEIIKKDKDNFNIILLSANKNYKDLLNQAKFFNVKNLIISDKKTYNFLLKKKLNKIKIYNNFDQFNKIFKKKLYYSMSAISGLSGLYPTLQIIKYSQKIAIANKESIICGWSLISKNLKKYNTQFIPVDSEHFSIWYGNNANNGNNLKDNIEKLYLTASGGPFLRTPLNKLKNIKVKSALNHPNWSMGKKISIDSASMMNKLFEIIEAKNIFDIPYSKLSIIINPSSYVHAILKFKNGMSKMIIHDTDMKIPIFNSLYGHNKKSIKSKNIDFKSLNNLNFQLPDLRRYPSLKYLNQLPNKSSLFETALISLNDELVDLFLKKKIKFTDIYKKMNNILKLKKFTNLKMKDVKNIKEIINVTEDVKLTLNLSIKNLS